MGLWDSGVLKPEPEPTELLKLRKHKNCSTLPPGDQSQEQEVGLSELSFYT